MEDDASVLDPRLRQLPRRLDRRGGEDPGSCFIRTKGAGLVVVHARLGPECDGAALAHGAVFVQQQCTHGPVP